MMAEKSGNPVPAPCINCGSEAIQNYCPVCGQKAHHKRFSVKIFFVSLLAAFNIERGFLYTFKMLFVDPGKVVRDYLSGRTRPYYNPLQYILVAAGIYAFLILWLKIFDQGIETANHLFISERMNANEEALEFQKKWYALFRQYVNFIPLLIIPFSSLISKWSFRSQKLWYGEHLILNTYFFGQVLYITVFLTPLVVIFPLLLTKFSIITTIFEILYFSYALRSTFKKSVFKSVFSAILILFLGMLFFIILLFILFMLVVFILAKLGIDFRQLLG